MAVPVAGEQSRGIVLLLAMQELAKARMACLDLLARGPPMIREVIAAAAGNREVDEAAECSLRGGDAVRRVRNAEIEDDAGPRLPRPCEESVLVALDEPDRAVND